MYGGYDRMARRITQDAERIKLPGSRRGRVTPPAPDPSKPVLVRGRGLARRRPRSPLASVLAALLAVFRVVPLALFV